MSPAAVRGRSCPLSYRYSPDDLAAPASVAAETVYVAGCLYGNTAALHAVIDRTAREPGALVVFNGDFHWLDVGPDEFVEIGETVSRSRAVLGNVEAELLGDGDHGCGCAYPDYVDDRTVELSNAVADRLRRTATKAPATVELLRDLPQFIVVDVGGARVAILHGDPLSLAGWRLAREAIDPDVRDPGPGSWVGTPTTDTDLRDWFARARVDVFACSHTGMPYLYQQNGPDQHRAIVVNNGRAGMPNFAEAPCGIMTRISRTPGRPHDSLYGTEVDALRVDAIPVDYDHDRWAAKFLEQWPPGSAGHLAYDELRRNGTRLVLSRARLPRPR